MVSTFNFSKQSVAPEQEWEVVLGSHTIKAFVSAPKDLQVIGIVRSGMEYGVLAKTDAGDYVRVNGSNVQALDHAQIDAAITKAGRSGQGAPYAARRAVAGLVSTLRAAPTVSMRRHRKIDPHLTASVCTC